MRLLVGVTLLVLLLVVSTAASALDAWRVAGKIDRHQLSGLACPSGGVCVAIDSSGDAVASTDPAVSDSWRARSVDPGRGLVAISCPSIALCVAVDSSGNIVSEDQNRWQVAASGAQTLNSVSCPSVTLCVIADGDGGTVENQTQAATAGSVLIATDPTAGTSAWTLRQVTGSLGPECGKGGGWSGCGNSIASVSCPSRLLCVAADQYGQTTESTDPADAAASAWSLSVPSGGYPVTSLSCPSTTLCMASCPAGDGLVIDNCPGETYYAAEVFSWTPTSHSTGGITQLSNSAVAVDCPSTSACFAFDELGNLWATSNPAASQPTWLRMRAAARRPAAADPIVAVACPTSKACVAVDQGGELLLGAPPPSLGQLRALLANHLVPKAPALARRELLRRAGYRLTIPTDVGGRFSITWLSAGRRRTVLASGTAVTRAGGDLRLTLKTSRIGRRALATTTPISLRAEGEFTPADGPPVQTRRTFTLVG